METRMVHDLTVLAPGFDPRDLDAIEDRPDDDVRALGPVGITSCNLARSVLSNCKLNQAAFSSCQLDELELHDCDLRGADLRDNDISEIVGLSSLRGVLIEDTQLPDLTAVVVRDMELNLRTA